MFRGRADHGGWPNSLIEGYQSAVIPHGKSQEISIGDLLRSQQLGMVEDLDIGETDIVGPEAMALAHLCHREALQDRGHGQRVRIAGAGMMRAVPFSVIGQDAQPCSRWAANQEVATA